MSSTTVRSTACLIRAGQPPLRSCSSVTIHWPTHCLVRTLPTLDGALEHAVFKFTHKHFDPDAVYQLSMVGPELDKTTPVGGTDLTAIDIADQD